jgi:hypothetical protein
LAIIVHSHDARGVPCFGARRRSSRQIVRSGIDSRRMNKKRKRQTNCEPCGDSLRLSAMRPQINALSLKSDGRAPIFS